MVYWDKNGGVYMDEQKFYQHMQEIEHALQQAGYNARKQLIGYLQTNDLAYITRKNDARSKICALDQEMLRRYIEQYRRDT